ncbi:hypothetical protein ABRP29_07355 [Pseudomonas sp. WHRI 8822A]|uniref:hypothetical protein n=1 Tax=Pseudomonas sp. WHRI 8822A TaxID=3162568 RepID=UPI0032EFCD16
MHHTRSALGNHKAFGALIVERGRVVHRSKNQSTGAPAAHLVKRDDLEKAIRFIRMLVDNTDQCFGAKPIG